MLTGSNGEHYFTGRSDAFATGTSTNPGNARLDLEGIRVAADESVYISDEYGPPTSTASTAALANAPA